MEARQCIRLGNVICDHTAFCADSYGVQTPVYEKVADGANLSSGCGHGVCLFFFRQSIDDFGTDYSSLSRLKQLPVDRMDMQFVQGIDKNEKDRAISKVIINLAKSLGMKVIEEGVENDAQLDS